MTSRVTRKDLLFASLLSASSFTLVYKLLTPATIVISVNNSTITSSTLPRVFTYTDVAIIAAASMIMGVTATALILNVPQHAPLGDMLLQERRKKWREIAKTLKNEEARVYSAVIEAGGIIRQSELPEKTGLSKSSVSRALDLLESKGLVERKRRGMGNIIVLK